MVQDAVLPKFNDDVLSYLKLKKRWKVEVVPERKTVALEHAAMRNPIPALAKAKIMDISMISMMTDFWKIWYMDYRNLRKVKAKLKHQVQSIKLKATGDSEKIDGLYHSLNVIYKK